MYGIYAIDIISQTSTVWCPLNQVMATEHFGIAHTVIWQSSMTGCLMKPEAYCIYVPIISSQISLSMSVILCEYKLYITIYTITFKCSTLWYVIVHPICSMVFLPTRLVHSWVKCGQIFQHHEYGHRWV